MSVSELWLAVAGPRGERPELSVTPDALLGSPNHPVSLELPLPPALPRSTLAWVSAAQARALLEALTGLRGAALDRGGTALLRLQPGGAQLLKLLPLEELHVPRLSLLTGGARSGKSGRAERLAERLAARAGLAVSVIVTAQAFDDEMRERIRRHRADRPSHWTTLEAPHDPLAALAGAQGVVLLDCLSLWVSNRMLQGAGEAVILEQARALAAALRERPAPAVAVTNEVGSGIVPDNALARAYRDVLGRVNATVASAADLVALCAAGEATALRGDARWLHQRPE